MKLEKAQQLQSKSENISVANLTLGYGIGKKEIILFYCVLDKNMISFISDIIIKTYNKKSTKHFLLGAFVLREVYMIRYFKIETASEIVFSIASLPYLSTSDLFFSP